MRHSDHIGPGSTVDAIFRHHVATARDHMAVVNGDERIGYGDLDDMVSRMVTYLEARGIKQGDRIAILSTARTEVVVVFLACARLRAIYLGLSPRLSKSELAYILTDATPAIIFSAAELDGFSFGALVTEVCDELAAGLEPIIFSAKAPALSREFAVLLEEAEARPAMASQAADSDPVVIIYTSGSTGAPKGALLSNANLIISGRAYMEQADLMRPRVISQLPIDHVGYVLCEMTAVLLAGGTLIQLPRFDIELLLSAIQTHRATSMICIPTMIQRLVDSGRLDAYDLSSMEFLWWAGPLPVTSAATMRKYVKRLAVSYGMTEAAGTITFSGAGQSDQILCSTVGRPHPDLDVRTVGEDGPEGSGEIQLRGPQIMLGYWNKPEQTQASFTEDGWFKTGDLGVFRGENLAIVGRIKEMIRSGGYNILPAEVEVALEEHEDVVMAFVCGVPDKIYGEAVHAIIHAREGAAVSFDDLSRFLKQRLSSVKVPKKIHIGGALPLLANGKINRVALRGKLEQLA